MDARWPSSSSRSPAIEHATTIPPTTVTADVDARREIEVPADQLTTTLATLTYDAPTTGLQWPRHFLEAVGFCVLGLAFGHAVGSQYAGVVSLFLASAALSSRFKQLLRRRRRASALQQLASVIPVGAGAFVAYVAVCVWLGPEGVRERFGFAVTGTGVGFEALDADRFDASWGLLGHNLLVLLSAFCLAFVYRGFGALLTLVWNAAAWAAALTLLVGPGHHVAVALVAVFPHLLLEGLAFTAGALAGVHAGTRISAERGWGPTLQLAGMGLGLLLLAWGVEGSWPGWVLR